jgi:nitrilase
VIAPNATYVHEPVLDQACILYADLELGRITEGHLFLDTQGHYSRPDVFRLSVDDRPQTGVSFSSHSEEVPHPDAGSPLA